MQKYLDISSCPPRRGKKVVNMTPLSRGGRTDDKPSREGAAVETRRGWELRLLLSLEERERTRTRLLVTEMLAAIITDIVNVIPGKVSQQQYSTWDSARVACCAGQPCRGSGHSGG